MKASMIGILCLVFWTGAFAQTTLREGTHNFTLQWISWDKPGKVVIIKKSDGTYSVKGEQRNADKYGFVTIDGVIKIVSPKELLFEGTIVTKDKTLNNGEACNKTGQYHFVAKGARKYWRLQEMDNCEGNSVVDYVDIYF